MRNITKLLALCLMVCVMVALSACVFGETHTFSEDWQNDAENHWHACTDEGCEEKSDVAAHTYGEGAVTTPATEDSEGVMTYTCTVCGYEKTEAIDKLAHTHTEETIPGKAATCTEKGLTDGKKCSTCGEILVAQEEIAALGHTEETIPGKAATCTEKGLTDGKKCTVCKTVTVEQTEIAAKGHTDANNDYVCDDCKADLCTSHTPAEAVKENVVEATCTEAGSYESVVKCSVCGEEISRETVTVGALGHTEAAAVEENRTESTCKVAGSYDSVVYCSVCKAEVKRNTVALELKEHSPAAAVEENRTESTCKVAGSYDSVVYCSACGDELDRDTVALELAQHSPAAAVEENRTESTCKVAGSYQSVVYCSVCNDELKRDTVALELADHTPAEAVKENEVKATCTAEGSYNLVVYCSVCNAKISSEAKTEEKLDHDTELAYTDASGHWYDCKNCDYVSEKIAHSAASEGVCTCGYTCATKCEICGSCADEDCTVCSNKCAFLDTSKIMSFAPNTVFGKAEGPDGKAPGSDGAYLTDESIVAEHITLADGKYATKFTLPNAVAAHTGVALRIDGNNYQAPGLAGYNCAIPMIANVVNPIRMYFTNNGTTSVTFKYSLIDYYYDKGAVELTLAAGESKTVILNALFDKNSVGLNHQVIFPNGAEAGASLTVRGEFVANDNFNSITVATPANQLRFGVGEQFNTEGLVLKANGTDFTRVYISDNYITNYDGHTFTADDIGTKTVFVMFGGKAVAYTITVDAHEHNVVFVPESAPVACVSDGVAAHYTCTVDGCGLYFGDEYGNEIIDAPATVSCHTAGTAATLPGTALTCGGCGAVMGLKPMDNWVYFTLTTQTSKIGSNIKNGKVEHADVEGMPGTKFYVGAGTIGATNESEFYLKMSSNDSGYQTVIPNLSQNAASGALRTVILFYKNYSDEPITMNLQNDAKGGNGKITVPANGTAVCEFTVKNVGGSNWFHYYVDCNPQKDVVFGVYGYFYVHDGETNDPTINKTGKTTYKVGETFTTEGLVINAVLPSGNNQTMYITSGYTTSISEGYTFTAADVGTHTVTVTFAGKTVTYPITVVGDADCENGNHKYGKVSDEALFVEMQGNNAVYKYACVYCGLASEETYVAAPIAFVPHHGSNDSYSLEYVTLDDGRIAAKLTFKTDVAAGTKFTVSANQYPAGTNTAFPVSGNGRRVYMEMISTANVNITWQPEFYGDRDGVTMDLVANEAQSAVWVIKYDTDASHTSSALPYQETVINSNVAAGTVVYITGAFYERGEIAGVDFKTPASKIVYSVGDKFTSEGITLKVSSTDALFANVSICNVTTDLDGYTFTEADLGVHTVTVTWGDFTLTYDILVIE
ncbi:MAG: bacterial Ig-like domain-containing protein [Clostridia bacterium]|nr:bacterial Ig-like domain-containing protein [Clostridia bacterium]